MCDSCLGSISGFPALLRGSAGFRGKDVLVKNNRFDLDLNEGLGDAVLVLNRYGNQYRYLFAEVVTKQAVEIEFRSILGIRLKAVLTRRHLEELAL